MPSVKELRVDREPRRDELGVGTFVFSDAYSVFDWGKMPDDIPGKGASLCAMGAATFESLQVAGIETHYLGVGDRREPRSLDSIEKPPRTMWIELTRVPDLAYDDGSYDYGTFHAEAGENYLVPLEIVFRNRVPIGSSLRRRTEPGDHDLDFAAWPDHAVELAVPIVEFSTKFEESDRYLDPEEADRIAGRADIQTLRRLARQVNEIVSQRAADAGLEHLDGKIECLYFDGEIKVADVAGTLDENRFAYEGRQLSKEVVRQYYKRHDPEWVNAVESAKREASRRKLANWRELCEREPRGLPAEAIDTIARMYAASANAYVDRFLLDGPPLHAVVPELERLGTVTKAK